MRTTIELHLPITRSFFRRRRWPTESGSLVIAASDGIEAADALRWFSALLFEACEGQVVVRPTVLWEKTRLIAERLEHRGVTMRHEMIAKHEYIAARCDSVASLQASLETLWPVSEALVCYRSGADNEEAEMLAAVDGDRGAYEDAYVEHLAQYKVFAFMESERLSVQFVGYEEPLLKAFQWSLSTSRR